MSEVSFWDNKDEANAIILKVNELKDVVEPILELEKSITDNINMLEMISDEDLELVNVIDEEYSSDKEKLEELELQTYLSGDYDRNNCIFEIHSHCFVYQ